MQTAATVAAPPEQRWLTCRLDKGMFSDERAVTYPPQGELQKSVFVPEQEVQGGIGTSGRVRVRVFRRDGHLLAVLPTPRHDVVEVEERHTSPL